MKRNSVYKLVCALCVMAAMCLFLSSAKPEPKTLDSLRKWQAGKVVTPEAVKAYGESKCFRVEHISDATFRRMNGKSFKPNDVIGRKDLRYIKTLHKNAEGQILIGEMVVNKAIAGRVLGIFRELYANGYPIERMVLIDDYDADDETSMRANNSSSFCFRAVAGTTKLSAHSRGMAIDINTLYNPYYKKYKNGKIVIQPSTAGQYCDRAKDFPYKIVKGDLCHRLFTKNGFEWGGDWNSCKDYQHFEIAK